MLSVVDKEVEVKAQMKQKYCTGGAGAFPDKFPYKTKAIFAFEVIDGVEVSLFSPLVCPFCDCSIQARKRRERSFFPRESWRI